MAMKSPQDMIAAVTQSMQQRTGRTLQQWLGVVNASGIDPLNQNAVRRYLKAEFGVLQNSQWAIADAAAKAAGWQEPTVEQYIDQQYSGNKAKLRPVFDRLRQLIESFGKDVNIEGRASYTPFVCRRQFVAIAATNSRLDIGLRFVDVPTSALLIPAKAPGQATHKISLTSVNEIDQGLEQLLRLAYEQNR